MISNCVINVVPKGVKDLGCGVMFLVLQPGGRVAVSDILLKKDLSAELKNNVALYVGCVAGASKVEAYEMYLREVGFQGEK